MSSILDIKHMRHWTGAVKRKTVLRCLDELNSQFQVVTMRRHADVIRRRGRLDIKPGFDATPVLERSR